jgi:hypothetical protein
VSAALIQSSNSIFCDAILAAHIIVPDHVGGFLADHDAGCIGVAVDD